jgi:regulatory protein
MKRRSGRAKTTEPPRDSARVGALRLLGRRDYSAAELTNRLLDKGYPAEDVARVVGDLVADGSVDDRRLAHAYARSASTIKGRGRLRIKRELEARGVSAGLAAEATRALDNDDERATIARFIARKRGTAPLDRKRRQRLYGQLIRRGFSADLIARALDADSTDD